MDTEARPRIVSHTTICPQALSLAGHDVRSVLPSDSRRHSWTGGYVLREVLALALQDLRRCGRPIAVHDDEVGDEGANKKTQGNSSFMPPPTPPPPPRKPSAGPSPPQIRKSRTPDRSETAGTQIRTSRTLDRLVANEPAGTQIRKSSPPSPALPGASAGVGAVGAQALPRRERVLLLQLGADPGHP